MTRASYCSGFVVLVILVVTQAAAQGTSDYADPQYPEGFSTWLWIAVSVASLLGLGIFILMHKRYWAWDHFLPYPMAMAIALLIVSVPSYVDQNFFGWFGRDCFQGYIVSGDRVLTDGARPAECVDARENIEALGIRYVIRKYQENMLDFSPLTTAEIVVVYGLMIVLWTGIFSGILIYSFRKVKIK